MKGKKLEDPTGTFAEDKWIYSGCGGCYSSCGIRVRVVNGVPVTIEGDPRSPLTQGSICGKGVSLLNMLFDPNRVNTPLKRTNPEKGMGIDPGWQPISWDEALDTIAAKLREVYEEDPREFLATHFPTLSTSHSIMHGAFFQTFGSPNRWAGGGGMMCGNATHFIAGILYGAWSFTADTRYCNYLIHFGASKGHSAGHGAGQMMRAMADGRARGMKQVVFDPVCNFIGGKASEWVPIIPGTDGAVALAMLNIILNEMNIWDDNFIKTKTDGPYLVGPDKRYIRDKKSDKPMIWDSGDGSAKTWDDPTIGKYSIEGTYEVDGVKCTPAFQLLREHVKKYTPEMASEVSTVPAETIRRIARELASAASIGTTITINGKELPYRPAAAICFRGINGHSNAFHTVLAIHLLNVVLGAVDAPGGAIGWPTRGFGCPQTGRPRYEPWADPVEGLMIGGWWHAEIQPGPDGYPVQHTMWPITTPTSPEQSLGLKSLYPMVVDSPYFLASDREELWEKLGVNYEPKILLTNSSNVIMSAGNLDNVSDFLKKLDFHFAFELYLSETTDFADIVLPDGSFLETLAPFKISAGYNGSVGLDDWYSNIQQPVIESLYERKMQAEIFLELAERIGPDFKEKMYTKINEANLLSEKYALDVKQRYTWEQIVDRLLMNYFGEDHNLEWFKENGAIIWPKQVEEAYWRYEIDARIPLYFDWLVKYGGTIEQITKSRGVEIDCERFTPLPEYIPAAPNLVKSKEHNFYAITYRDILHTGTFTQENPAIDEASLMNPYTYNIIMNEDVAKEMDIEDGDLISVESDKGRVVTGTVKTMQGIHPQVVGFAGTQGHWSKRLPVARDKGVHFNDLLEIDKEHIDPVSLSLESTVKVKVYKA